MSGLNILLVQLASNGDCLFATTLAKQIKEIDYPGCNLTWMIGENYKSAIYNNPYVDSVIEIPVRTFSEIQLYRNKIPELIQEAKKTQHFNHVFVTDLTIYNFHNWFGTIRASIFRNYPHPLKISPQPIIFLSQLEKEKVDEFCKINKITNSSYNILFECSPQSSQSRMNINTAMNIAKEIVLTNQNCKVILSSAISINTNNENIIDGSTISWRCNAELVNYCDLLIGCSSGISWLAQSNWCKTIPTIQIIDNNYTEKRISASMKKDFEYFKINNFNIIEMHNPSQFDVLKCALLVISGNLSTAEKIYDRSSGYHIKYSLTKIEFLFVTYKQIYLRWKPKWFTPKLWLKSIKRWFR